MAKVQMITGFRLREINTSMGSAGRGERERGRRGEVAAREWMRGAAALTWQPLVGRSDVAPGWTCPAGAGGSVRWRAEEFLGFGLRDFRKGSHIYR